MKKFFLMIAAMVVSVAAFADAQRIRSVDVKVTLLTDGTARIEEQWDVHVTSGTEWYLVKQNLGDIEISDFCVTDENGNTFMNIGDWDVDLSLEQKAGRCGIVRKSDGCELCWGVGSMGDHVFTASYTMSNAVKSLNDYDMLHLQLVSPGLSAKPELVTAYVKPARFTLDSGTTLFWGFGYVGRSEFNNGGVLFTSTEQFRHDSSLIVLLRFNKGYFNSSSVQDRDFQAVLDTAMEGADFGSDEDEDDEGNPLVGILGFLAACLGIGGLAKVNSRVVRKNILGQTDKNVDWCRDIPFNGDLVCSQYVLEHLGEQKKSNSLAGAMILDMIYKGYLAVNKDANGKIEISFTSKDKSGLDSVQLELYKMMLEASGDDSILQDKEFSKWSRKHTTRVSDWAGSINANALGRLDSNGWRSGGKFTAEGQKNGRNVLGFRKFLQDFTLINERETPEVALWQQYLVFGTLYGISGKVLSQLKDIDPKVLEQTMMVDVYTIDSVLRMTSMYGNAITNAQAASASSAKGGFGGGSSFGGGGGFSGGGFGGGSR